MPQDQAPAALIPATVTTCDEPKKQRKRIATQQRDQEMIVDMVEHGMSERECAKKHGVGHATPNKAKKRQEGFLRGLLEKVQRGKEKRFLRTVNRNFAIANQKSDLRSAVNAMKLIYENLYGFGGKGGGVTVFNGDVQVNDNSQHLHVEAGGDALRVDADRAAELRSQLGLDGD